MDERRTYSDYAIMRTRAGVICGSADLISPAFIASTDKTQFVLSILGGLTPELVEKAAKNICESVYDYSWDDAKERIREDRRAEARAALEAVFGVDG